MKVSPFSVLLTLKCVETEGIMATIRLLLPFYIFYRELTLTWFYTQYFA